MDLLSMFGEFPGIGMISRTHLLMSFDTDSSQVSVSDPGSKNGTYPSSMIVDDVPKKVRLADVITISLVVSELGREDYVPSPDSEEGLISYISESVRSFTDSFHSP